VNVCDATVTTQSPEETERLGEILARLLEKGGTVALRGELAAGKTCFVRGMARAFTTERMVHSPTFTLVNEYGKDRRLYHMDLYRLGSLEEVAELGFEELFEGDGLCAVEWADRAESLLPARRVDVYFEHAGADQRRITIRDCDLLPSGWRERIAGFSPSGAGLSEI
jgi:tRNA threonylcarbamoyladenosine biosynthesis protein TsaE